MSGTHPDPTGCTCARLRKLARATSRLYDQHLSGSGLNVNQYSMLMHAVRGGPLPLSELAGLLATERTTLTRNLRPLADAGWVELRPGADARQRIVTVTPAGRAQLEAARPAWRAAQDKIEALLGKGTVNAMHAQLDAALATLTPHLDE